MNFIKSIAVSLSLLLFSISAFAEVESALYDTFQEEKELVEEGKLKGESNKEVNWIANGGGDGHGSLHFLLTEHPELFTAIHFSEFFLTSKSYSHSTKTPLYILFHSLKIHCC